MISTVMQIRRTQAAIFEDIPEKYKPVSLPRETERASSNRLQGGK